MKTTLIYKLSAVLLAFGVLLTACGGGQTVSATQAPVATTLPPTATAQPPAANLIILFNTSSNGRSSNADLCTSGIYFATKRQVSIGWI